jgi:hypothetical protein
MADGGRLFAQELLNACDCPSAACSGEAVGSDTVDGLTEIVAFFEAKTD